MSAPVGLGLAGDPARYGNKAAGLARVSGRLRVPPGLALPGDWLAECLGPASAGELTELLAQLLSCPDERLPALVADVARLAGRFQLGDRAELLAERTSGLGPSLVVRSSSADEDGAQLSFAGVFESIVDVETDQLAEAVRQVWLSGWSARALLQYRRLGRIPRPDHLSVLIQRAIRPRVAGVAFSEPSGDAFVEWTAGHGAELVGGLAVPTRERLNRLTGELAGWRRELRSALAALSRNDTGHDVEWGHDPGHDVEWVWDGDRLWIVQVRPRTAELAGHQEAGLRTVPLYEGDAHDLTLGACAAEYTRIRGKRRLPRAIAIARGARVPAGWLVNWDPTAPVECTGRLEQPGCPAGWCSTSTRPSDSTSWPAPNCRTRCAGWPRPAAPAIQRLPSCAGNTCTATAPCCPPWPPTDRSTSRRPARACWR